MSKKVIVNLLESMGVLAISRYLNRRSPIVLMYHRVLRHDLIPGTDPVIFDKQMAYVKKHFNVINMSQLFDCATRGKLPDRSLVLTFDDGHHDFYANAWPIIKRYDLTATLFVTTDFVDQKIWLWPDLLRYILIHAKPREVLLKGVLLPIDNATILTTWNTLGDFCLELSSEERKSYIHDLAAELNVTIPESPQMPFAPTNWQQLQQMVEEGLDVGSHSVTHPILSSLTLNQLQTELTESKARIKEMLKIDAVGICYPNGMPSDISLLVQEEAHRFYSYGVVAYPKKFDPAKIMRIGRIGATNDLTNFKIKTSYLARAENLGEYK